MALSDVKVRNAKPEGKQVKLSDGDGMYLLVTPNGGKCWRLKYRFGGKEKVLALGRRSISFPTAPSADEVAKYKRHVWESDQLDKIESTIMAYIDSMGMPSTEFQNAIFNENQERRQKALQDDIDLINAKTSARGYKYSNGATHALIADLIEKNRFDRENLNRLITVQMTDWARQNLMFAVQQGASIEESHMNFAHKYSIIYREIYTTQLNGILEKYRVGVMQEMSKLDGVVKIVAARAEVLRANMEIQGKEDQAWLQKNQLEINESLGRYSTAVQAMLGQATTEVQAANAYATVASHLVQGVSNNVLGIATSSSKSQ